METVVISVGGSMINPSTVNVPFLKELKPVLFEASKKRKIVVVTGGGFIARDYIRALKDKPSLAQSQIGIQCTRLNAHLVASYLERCNPEVALSLRAIKRDLRRYSIVVAAGPSEPGSTSDSVSAHIAKSLNARALINLTNVKGLYSKDPKKHKDARFIRSISHVDFKKIMDRIEEKPGQHFVLDSLAAKICRQSKIKVIIISGTKTLQKVLEDNKFEGTTIS